MEAAFAQLTAIPNLHVLRDAPLSRYTRFAIGGPALIYAETESVDSFLQALAVARASGLPYMVIGGGTNLIVSDAGFPGIMLRFVARQIRQSGHCVSCDAGAVLQDLVDFTIGRGLQGLETLAGIPGSVGAAVYGNAGAYGHSISERVRQVCFYDGRAVRTFTNAQCQFHYRESIFKQHKDWIIFSTDLELEPADAAALQQTAAGILRVRNEKFPVTMKCAGSIFKNLLLNGLSQDVATRVPASVIREGKVPAAWFLEQVGAKGMSRGDIHVASYHANLIYNAGQGTAADLCALIRELQNRVLREFGLALEEEVQYVGFAATSFAQTTPELVRVNDRVYCATGYALGNVIFILTDSSVVVVDTTEGQEPAQAVLNDFRQISALPISHIIYTHHHGDHINGAQVFAGPETQIIAQQNHAEELRKYRLLKGYNRKLNRAQWAAHVPRQQRGVSLAVDLLNPGESGYLEPTVTFDQQYVFSEGGLRFELYHTQGETVDHLMVWLPDLETLLPGDLFYWSFPMLASPGKPDRPVLEWAASLDRMRPHQPAYLVPSHSRPLEGRGQIDQALENYARAIRWVHDETVERMNEGRPLFEICREVRLPPDLAALPYLQPVYGTVEWGVIGVFRQYTGWYDFDPAHLRPSDPCELHRALVELAGGAAPVLERARQAAAQGQLQLALQLAQAAGGGQLRAELLERIAHQTVNSVERNIYLEAAATCSSPQINLSGPESDKNSA